jgi:hypothetical protein
VKKRKTRRQGEAETWRKSRGAGEKVRTKRKVLRKTPHVGKPARNAARSKLHGTLRKGYLEAVCLTVVPVLREWIADAGVTFYAVAEAANIDHDTLYAYFTGKRAAPMPTVPVLARCCRALGRTLTEFFAEAEKRARDLPPPPELGSWEGKKKK